MAKKRRTEITIETDEFFSVRRKPRAISAWCGECGAVVRMVTTDQAALAAGVSSRTIYRWLEESCIHYTGGLAAYLSQLGWLA